MAYQFLTPNQTDTFREVSIEEIQSLASETANKKFAQDFENFLATYHPNDTLVEFCSATTAWRKGLGWLGFELIRAGEIIARFRVKLS